MTSIGIGIVASVAAMALISYYFSESSGVVRLAVTTLVYGVVWVPLLIIFVIRKSDKPD